jgi:phenylpropionate dioxygenase-like ring-hydroxylating dioxygenase large terminal subunit
MNRTTNDGTQPHRDHPVFNSWDVVSVGWYLLDESRAISRGQVKAYELGGQRVVVFRGEDGGLRALDAFCPHMGTDLGIGKVQGNELRCFFHHWRFDGAGRCVDIPCGEPIPARTRLQAYDVRELYDHIWIWPEEKAPEGVPEFPELAGLPVYAIRGRGLVRPCHAHVFMINGLDAQHLRTVHDIPIQMSLETREESDGRIIDFKMSGDIPSATPVQRLVRAILGPRYAYSMRYVDATLGLLTTLQDVKWFGRFPAEPTRMIFAYTPLAPGQTRVQPLYIARKPAPLTGRMASYARLFLTAMGFRWLRDEDGQVYDNIRFQTGNMLRIDQGVMRFIQYVNQLRLSAWSTTHAYPVRAESGRPSPLPSTSTDAAPAPDREPVTSPGPVPEPRASL